MSRERVTPAVILRTRALREADLVVVLLTPDDGKLECIARGARRSRRRFPGGLPVGARGQARVAPGRGSLATLAGFAPSFDHARVGRDLDSFAYVAYLCELSEQLIGGSTGDPGLFAQLSEAIEAVSAAPRPSALRRFELGLLAALGLLPALARCGVCGAPPLHERDSLAFSLARGGVLCAQHAAGGRRLAAVLELAQVVLEADSEAAEAAYAAADRLVRRELRDLGRELLRPHLRGPLRSLAFFAQIAAQRASKP